MKQTYFFIAILFLSVNICSAQQDTLKVITYNVLGYGDGCQGTDNTMHAYLKTIVQYEHPDIMGFVKMQIQNQFADSVLKLAMNAAYPGEYNYCTYTNVSHSNNMDLLLYNQNKLGFVSVTTLTTIKEDFDLFKLYYEDPFLSATHDSTFIYVVLCHTVSGSNSSQRDQQDSATEKELTKIFYHLPNLIYMGDFNTRTSGEPGYHFLTNNPDTDFSLSDPPFSPDSILHAPIDWGNNPTLAASELTTTTRLSATIPNSCGTSGGGKDWYDHILLSSWVTSNTDYIHYVKDSYKTIGNDGKRVGISINDTTYKNSSVPANVLNALFNFSDKYPVMVKLLVSYNSTGKSPANPVVNSINKISPSQDIIGINNPVHKSFTLHFPPELIGQRINTSWYDVCGRLLYTEEYIITGSVMNKATYLTPGIYLLHIQAGEYSIIKKIIQE